MRPTTPREVEAVVKLDGPARFDHFVKRVADAAVAWSLWDAGWALMEDNDGTKVFPLWPAREYAELFLTGAWKDCEVREIALADLTDVLLPNLAAKGVLPGVFPTPRGKGVTPSVHELVAALMRENDRYES